MDYDSRTPRERLSGVIIEGLVEAGRANRKIEVISYYIGLCEVLKDVVYGSDDEALRVVIDINRRLIKRRKEEAVLRDHIDKCNKTRLLVYHGRNSNIEDYLVENEEGRRRKRTDERRELDAERKLEKMGFPEKLSVDISLHPDHVDYYRLERIRKLFNTPNYLPYDFDGRLSLPLPFIGSKELRDG